MSFISERNDKWGQTVVQNLKRRHFDADYCATKQDAVSKVLSLIEEGASVSWGGFMSMQDSGLDEALKKGNYVLLDRDAVPPEERKSVLLKAMQCDCFLMSANAIAATGELVNIDGTGNRVAALCFGPKKVIVLAGMNKVMPTLQDAVMRARNTAAPINAMRFDLQTPCKKTGQCADCTCPDSICSQLLITRLNRIPGRIHVVLCGESLGF